MKQLIHRLRIAALAATVAVAGMAPAMAEPPMAPEQKRAIEKLIRDYLLENPEIVVQAMEKLQEKRRAAEAEASRLALSAKKDELLNDPTSPVGGDRNGDVTVVEFFDYRCGVCRRVHPIVASLMKGDKRLRRVYKEWPILGPKSVYAARAALASRRQGKYLAFHKALMESPSPLTEESILTIAESVGLNRKRLVKDMKRPEIADTLRRNFALASSLKLNGTPSFVIGDTLLRGGRDLQTMQKVVAESRSRK